LNDEEDWDEGGEEDWDDLGISGPAAPAAATTGSGIPQSFRRKVFIFPKNTTVAEVIELGLERFGISEGVVDGGDEVEDKGSKRRSASRVRYGLNCLSGGQGTLILLRFIRYRICTDFFFSLQRRNCYPPLKSWTLSLVPLLFAIETNSQQYSLDWI
jgi:hypothetical protein